VVEDESRGPLRERSRDRIERDDSFRALSITHPLQARLLLAFFSFADDAIEALEIRGDVRSTRGHWRLAET